MCDPICIGKRDILLIYSRTKIGIILLISIFIMATGLGCDDNLENDRKSARIQTSEEMGDIIEDELIFGANSDTIEAFFQQYNIEYSFDRFQSRYQAIIRDVSIFPFVDKSIVIYININEQRRFSDYEIKESYVAP